MSKQKGIQKKIQKQPKGSSKQKITLKQEQPVVGENDYCNSICQSPNFYKQLQNSNKYSFQKQFFNNSIKSPSFFINNENNNEIFRSTRLSNMNKLKSHQVPNDLANVSEFSARVKAESKYPLNNMSKANLKINKRMNYAKRKPAQQQEQHTNKSKLVKLQNQLIQLNDSIMQLDQQNIRDQGSKLFFDLNNQDYRENDQKSESVMSPQGGSTYKIKLLSSSNNSRFDRSNLLILGQDNNKDHQKLNLLSAQVCTAAAKISEFITNNKIKSEAEIPETNEIYIYDEKKQKMEKKFKCKQCEAIFEKSCALGGHTSRVHKREGSPIRKKKNGINIGNMVRKSLEKAVNQKSKVNIEN